MVGDPVDVGLVLEGTYPFHLGGVSTWTQSLAEDLPDVSFGVVHLSGRDDPGAPVLTPPPNVRWVRVLRLPDHLDAFDAAPLADGLPVARTVHALSTGFASEVGAAWAAARNARFLVTEHGLSWREIERGATELETGLRVLGHDLSGGNPCANRALWADRFRAMARRAYTAADVVTTVCDANRAEQLALGLDAARSRVVPNGVALPDLTGPLIDAETTALHPSAALPATVRIGFVGRVTPLKDVLAFLRAAARVSRHVPGARFFVIGPTDDSPYLDRCRAAASMAGLADRLHFTGPQPTAPWYRHLDAVALTSVSEAQPLALLEAMAHGRAVVATDVGGCRSLVCGADGLGAAGVVVPPGDDGALADALLAVATDADARRAFGAVGRERVARHHTRRATADAYRSLYAQSLPQ